jgi:hypothetical protein
MTNLRFMLEALNSRDYAVEKNPLSPGGNGYTGLEAFLLFPHLQSQAINTFDTRGYILKLNALINECTKYTDAKTAREDPGRTKRCTAALGPNQIGINQPDPSANGEVSSTTRSTRSAGRKRHRRHKSAQGPQAGGGAPQQQAQAPGAGGSVPVPGNGAGGALDPLLQQLPVPGAPSAPAAPQVQAPASPQTGRDGNTAKVLLDFLLKP